MIRTPFRYGRVLRARVFASAAFGVVASSSLLLAQPAIDSVTNAHGAVTSRVARLPVMGPVTEGVVTGELKKWHVITVAFDGPPSSEIAVPNPFRNMRLNVRFSHPDSGRSFLVPGFFAADGDAAETSATSGNQWQVRFAPDETGAWLYVASFRVGTDVAASDDPDAGDPGNFDGAEGSFVIGPSDKTGRDLRGRGRLEYVGKHHLRFAETGEWFLKCGADAPENLLNYADFDDVPNVGNRQKTWFGHAADYDPEDAAGHTWQGGRGANLLGAIRYLSDKGLNAFSFLTFNIDGDDDNVFPHLLNGTVADFQNAPNNRRWAGHAVHHDRFDVSRLEQWERIFSYGDRKGMFLHFKTQETENEMWMDDGETGLERRLYYRELIARFGHHLALNWNLGEEDGALGAVNQNTPQRQAMAQYFHDHDPYHHLIVIHNGKDPDDLLGNASKLTGFSLQTSRTNFSQVHSRTLVWVKRSAAAGKPWVVACDEPGDASHGLVPDEDIEPYDPGRNHSRQNGLWGHLMAGGAGLEWYFGYQHDHSDLTCEDWRSRDLFWDQCRHALEFFRDHAVPFWEMSNADSLTDAVGGYCLGKPGEIYVVFLKTAAVTSLDLAGAAGEFTVGWFDPRNGGPLRMGSVARVTGGGRVSLGAPPADSADDWVALVRRLPTTAALHIAPAGDALQLAWEDPRFRLQHASEPSGSWRDVEPPAISPQPVQPTSEQAYFRLKWSDLLLTPATP